MPIDVIMPQMGESVTEGTVTKWLKKVGESIGRDEPLFEISTDKVDAEIPSPAAGVVSKILVSEGQTVAVHSVVAQIETASGAEAVAAESKPVSAKAEPAPAIAQPKAAEAPAQPAPGARKEPEEEIRSSPLVRRLAAEHNVDLSEIQGTGLGGRITKEDVLAFAEKRKAPPAAGTLAFEVPGRERGAPPPAAGGDQVVPMSTMRKKIAEHMVLSRRTSAHVSTVFQVDLTKVAEIHRREIDRFEKQEHTKLGLTAFFIRAIIDGLKQFPILNSSLSGDNIIYHKNVHMGVAVALDWGLIVPVIHNADEKSFLGLVRAINDLAERARHKKLQVEEVQGGTFTITNPGALGGLFAAPIINQPQVGIVGVGAVTKMPLVINDSIAIRSVVHLTLSYDHRLIDGFVADQFMASVKKYLENWDENLL